MKLGSLKNQQSCSMEKITIKKFCFYVIFVLFFVSFADAAFNPQKVSSEKSFGVENGQIQADTVAVCRSYIPFAVDVSTKLTAAQFKALKSFLFRPFLSSLFPVDIQPAPFSTYSEQNHGYRRPNNVSDITTFISNAAQGSSTYSFVTRPLKYFVDQNVTGFATANLAVNTVIFAGNSISASDVQLVQYYISILTEYANTVTIVLMNPDIDQTYYQQIPGLNLVVWSDPQTTAARIRNVMKCGQSSTNKPSPSPTTVSTTVSPGPVHVCRSYIPFSIDISSILSAEQFRSMKNFVLDPLLSSVFPWDVQPAPFSFYAKVNSGYSRQANVTDIIDYIIRAYQQFDPDSYVTAPLSYFVSQNMTGLGQKDGLPVNTIIFAGDVLQDSEVANAQNYANQLTVNGNTLTVVLMNPKVNQTNYRQISGLNLVVWSGFQTTVAQIRNVMKCGQSSTNKPSPSPTTVTTTVSPSPVYVCRSYIPFSFDVSTKLTSEEFHSMKNFLLNPFLNSVFPWNVHPAPFSTYADDNYAVRRQANVTSIMNYITVDAVQQNVSDSYITAPLSYFIGQNVMNLGSADRLPVNTIIFAGDVLQDSELADAQNYANQLTVNNNTLTVVLVNPNVNQTNYKMINGLNLVPWTDTASLISQIESNMNCLGGTPPTKPTTVSPTSPSSTTITTSQYIPCQSWISFSADNSAKLFSKDFHTQLTFDLDRSESATTG